jgi:hypothetical protein
MTPSDGPLLAWVFNPCLSCPCHARPAHVLPWRGRPALAQRASGEAGSSKSAAFFSLIQHP